jgi:glycerol kinase
LQIRDVFTTMERDLRAPLTRLFVDEGATRNDLLMQFQADLLGRPVQRLKVLELSAFGAGVLAGATSGLIDEARIEAMLRCASDQIDPCLDPTARQAKISVWSAAVNSVISRAETR